MNIIEAFFVGETTAKKLNYLKAIKNYFLAATGFLTKARSLFTK